MSYFKEMTPESQGIHSSAIIRFLDEVDRRGLELHRLMVIRHGFCVAKSCWAPYKEDDLHPVYSFTKSFTSTAIGFAVREGLLSLEDRLVDIFPEYVPEPAELLLPDGSVPKASYPSENSASTLDEMMENLKAITVHDLLCMTCGHEDENENRGETWLETFFRQPVLYRPGTFFKYNTAGTNVLAAILKRKTGQHLTEYLQTRLFDPLEMGEIFCYHMEDPMRVQAGGFGMKLTLENMARFTYFMLHDGYWNGEPILPGWYSLMRQPHAVTENDSEGHIKDWAMGYGYQCWMGTVPGSFRADGAYGQFGLVFPKQDMIVIINSACEQTQEILDCVNEYLVAGVNSIELLESEEVHPSLTKAITIARDAKAGNNQHTLAQKLENLKIPSLQSCHNPSMESMLEDRLYHADGRCCGLKTLVGGAGLFPFPDDTAISQMAFLFADDHLIWLVEEASLEGKEGESYLLKASLENTFLRSRVERRNMEYAASARWRSRRCLEMEIRRMDAMSGVRLLFRFEGSRIRIEADETLMTDGGLGMTERNICEFVCL